MFDFTFLPFSCSEDHGGDSSVQESGAAVYGLLGNKRPSTVFVESVWQGRDSWTVSHSTCMSRSCLASRSHKTCLREHQVLNPDSNLDHNPHAWERWSESGFESRTPSCKCMYPINLDVDMDQNPGVSGAIHTERVIALGDM